MIIKRLELGPIMANCYILGCERTKESVVVDPGDEPDKVLMSLSEEGLRVKYLINTHGHFDHVGANKRLKEVTGAELLIHSEDEPMLSELSSHARAFGLSADNSPGADRYLSDKDEITFGDSTLRVIHTPGHSRGGVCLYDEADGLLFAGDTLFAGSIGRTDLPGGSFDTLISSIRNKVFTLPDDTVVHTGHGPETSIGREKKINPFFS